VPAAIGKQFRSRDRTGPSADGSGLEKRAPEARGHKRSSQAPSNQIGAAHGANAEGWAWMDADETGTINPHGPQGGHRSRRAACIHDAGSWERSDTS
jgi:hypothetical protein